MSPQKTRVFVRQAEDAYEYGYPPENLVEFQAWLSAAVAEVPEEFRATAVLEFTAESRYEVGDIRRGMKFYYVRPATEVEFAERLHARALNILRGEARERREVERLQAKFGKS
ncbi:MAG: hypothetical protein ACTS8S_00510 [Giesbergeria sp.]